MGEDDASAQKGEARRLLKTTSVVYRAKHNCGVSVPNYIIAGYDTEKSFPMFIKTTSLEVINKALKGFLKVDESPLRSLDRKL